MDTREILGLGPVIPVIVVEQVDQAVPLARALVAGGVRVLEITLRTPLALEAVRAIVAAVPEAVVGVGTVVSPGQVEQALQAGARFAVSPGLGPAVVRESQRCGLPLLPGVITPGEILQALEFGLSALKFFPAEPAGGVGMLRALHGPFPHVSFCPTGGITTTNAPEYLGLPNVACVGGTWLAPRVLMEAGDWTAITRLAQAASHLRHQAPH